MAQEQIIQGDLLFHAVHGLCRVNEIMKQSESGEKVVCYSLVPKVVERMKVRFIITAGNMEASGFHLLVSLKEANEILQYLKAGNTGARLKLEAVSSLSQENQIWVLAKALLSFAHDNWDAKDKRTRQMLDRSAKGLVGELAFVFKMTLEEMAEKIRKSLGEVSTINPLVLGALAHVGVD